MENEKQQQFRSRISEFRDHEPGWESNPGYDLKDCNLFIPCIAQIVEFAEIAHRSYAAVTRSRKERSLKLYRIKHGDFAGLLLEHALLRWPAEIYKRGNWAVQKSDNEPRLKPFRREFTRLWELLCHAQAVAKCRERGCIRVANFMVFTQTDYGYSPKPEFWCKRHGPDDPDFDSRKVPISMEEIRRFKTKRDQKYFAKKIRHAIGIPNPIRSHVWSNQTRRLFCSNGGMQRNS
jgi:hypothetical protein